MYSSNQLKHALVFGSSGVSGWALVNELLHDYPHHGVWGRVTALTNRPLDHGMSHWPEDKRLNIVSGIDLLKGSLQDLEEVTKTKISDVDSVTHIFYYAYKASKDLKLELDEAVEMFKRAITVIDHLSPRLEFVVLQTGAKMYGFALLQEHYLPTPLSECLPRLRQPYHDLLFYHPQLDWIASFCKDKRWTWCETRPDIIVGFVPNSNYYSLATSLGVFLTLYVELEGKGSELPFPGTMKSWKAKSNEAGSDMIARQTIYISLHKDTCGNGEAFNVASSSRWENWERRWPLLCQYFGLKGTPPTENPLEVRTYINEHIEDWKEIEKRYGLRSGIANSERILPGFEYFHLTQADFDRHYDMSKLAKVGFAEEHVIMDTWGTTFNRMREAKIIP